MRNIIPASAVIALLAYAPFAHSGGPLVTDLAPIAAATTVAATREPAARQVAWPICADETAGFGWRVDPFTGKRAFQRR